MTTRSLTGVTGDCALGYSVIHATYKGAEEARRSCRMVAIDRRSEIKRRLHFKEQRVDYQDPPGPDPQHVEDDTIRTLLL